MRKEIELNRQRPPDPLTGRKRREWLEFFIEGANYRGQDVVTLGCPRRQGRPTQTRGEIFVKTLSRCQECREPRICTHSTCKTFFQSTSLPKSTRRRDSDRMSFDPLRILAIRTSPIKRDPLKSDCQRTLARFLFSTFPCLLFCHEENARCSSSFRLVICLLSCSLP